MRQRVLLVANVLTHYRLPLYEALQERVDLRVVFYSDGGEWYWRRTEQPNGATLRDASWLKGFWLGRTRIALGLIRELVNTDADVIVKDPNGKFALPVAYAVAKLRRKPFVFWASLWEHPSSGIHRFTRPIMRHVYRNSDAIVTYGQHVSEFVIREGASPETTFVAPQAVRQVIGPRPHLKRWAEPVRFLLVARLEHWKGAYCLLQALAKVQSSAAWRLDIVGDGEERLRLQRLSDELQLSEKVCFHGKLPNSELPEMYAHAAAVVVPSIRTASFAEPWSLVVNEAMHAGSLVIASDAVGAVRDGLVDGSSRGLVFAAGSVTELCRTLERVLDAANAADWVQMAARAQHHVATSYTYSASADGFVSAISAATDARTRP